MDRGAIQYNFVLYDNNTVLTTHPARLLLHTLQYGVITLLEYCRLTIYMDAI